MGLGDPEEDLFPLRAVGAMLSMASRMYSGGNFRKHHSIMSWDFGGIRMFGFIYQQHWTSAHWHQEVISEVNGTLDIDLGSGQ